MSDPRVAVGITAEDKTAKGVKSAEKHLGQIGRHVSAANEKSAADSERRIGRHARSMVRTFGEVEQASARVFGGRSLSSGLAGRLGALRAAGSAAGSGLGEAAAAGGVLEGTLGAVGAVAGATLGAVVALAVGAFKLADGFAKSATSVGNLASLIGVSTKGLTEFQAAAERVGVDKDAASGALGGLSQTLNDARYGRNSDAQAVLAKLRVGMKLKSNGDVDVEAMLPALADAISSQGASGRRTVAGLLGISTAALPAFTQGGKALSTDMTDAEKDAMIITDDDVTLGRRLTRKHAIASQLHERTVIGGMRRGAAQGVDVTEDALIRGAGALGQVVHDTFKPAAEKQERAADKLERAAGQIESAAAESRGVHGAGRLTAGQVAQRARHAQSLVEEAMSVGFSRAEAIGIAANVEMESRGDHRSREKGSSGAGRGLIQWTDPARKAKFREVIGVDVERSSRDQQWRFIRWETENSRGEKRNWDRALRNGQDPASIAAGYARYVERPADKPRDSAERAAVAGAMVIQLDIKGLPSGTSVRATSNGGAKPAVSHAFAR